MMTIRKNLRDSWVRQPVMPETGSILDPGAAEQLSLHIAYLGAGHVSPNPMVGAVFTDANHRFLGAGAHCTVGYDHAEINALADVRKRTGSLDVLRGAKLTCTLEPCSHHGRTGPCADVLAGLRLHNVTIGAIDSNPAVSGRGREILEKSGSKVSLFTEEGQREAKWLAEPFFHRIKTGKTFVALKAAHSLTGALARPGDQNRAISSPRAREYGHFLRQMYDAIAIGAQTLIDDNPTLTVRAPIARSRTPMRVVLDPELRGFKSRKTHNILKAEPERVLWVTTKSAPLEELRKLASAGVTVAQLPLGAAGNIMARDILNSLHELGIQSLLLEGGAGLYGSFLNERLVNRFHLFASLNLICGEPAIGWTSGLKTPYDLALSNASISPIENEILIEGSAQEL